MIDSIFESNEYHTFNPSQSIQPSSDDWLNLSPDEVNDIISEKQQELEAYLQRRKNKENLDADDKSSKNEENNGLEDQENDENPIENLASCVKDFVKKSSNFEGIKSKGGTKKEQEDVDSSSEDESDEFYRYMLLFYFDGVQLIILGWEKILKMKTWTVIFLS